MQFTRTYKVMQVGTGDKKNRPEIDSTHLYVHMPAEWIREQGLQKGMPVTVEVNDDCLIVRKAPEEGKKK